ncbi:MAG TPA: ATP-grasp domain-containing protein [Staphylococcus ureilyticus]|uniref:ATP-grasp domain-containing protein n=1 Tax=Staphylococcus ureilyticus TaxID=94138 RepID=UPI001DA12636|nr:ATP-grasp domain-containing protein [Staphylococcus ureilyticus]HJG68240.1 ATP-grasp domain-containing protein [Staphylococcus ureilyticus]
MQVIIYSTIEVKGHARNYLSRKWVSLYINDYVDQPAGFSLDFGVTKTGQTLLIEVNEGYSLASYGLYDIRYAKLLAARWAELTDTVDECAFDLDI